MVYYYLTSHLSKKWLPTPQSSAFALPTQARSTRVVPRTAPTALFCTWYVPASNLTVSNC